MLRRKYGVVYKKLSKIHRKTSSDFWIILLKISQKASKSKKIDNFINLY